MSKVYMNSSMGVKNKRLFATTGSTTEPLIDLT